MDIHYIHFASDSGNSDNQIKVKKNTENNRKEIPGIQKGRRCTKRRYTVLGLSQLWEQYTNER